MYANLRCCVCIYSVVAAAAVRHCTSATWRPRCPSHSNTYRQSVLLLFQTNAILLLKHSLWQNIRFYTSTAYLLFYISLPSRACAKGVIPPRLRVDINEECFSVFSQIFVIFGIFLQEKTKKYRNVGKIPKKTKNTAPVKIATLTPVCTLYWYARQPVTMCEDKR